MSWRDRVAAPKAEEEEESDMEDAVEDVGRVSKIEKEIEGKEKMVEMMKEQGQPEHEINAMEKKMEKLRKHAEEGPAKCRKELASVP